MSRSHGEHIVKGPFPLRSSASKGIDKGTMAGSLSGADTAAVMEDEDPTIATSSDNRNRQTRASSSHAPLQPHPQLDIPRREPSFRPHTAGGISPTTTPTIEGTGSAFPGMRSSGMTRFAYAELSPTAMGDIMQQQQQQNVGRYGGELTARHAGNRRSVEGFEE